MLNQREEDNILAPEIRFDDIIKYQGRSNYVNERQVTVSRYRTYSQFNFNEVKRAVQKCTIKAADDFGVIRSRTSIDSEASNDMIQSPATIQSDLSDEWVRALFATIGNKSFQWLDFNTQDIYEYLIEGVISETFLIDYYRDKQKELRFLTYGGSRYAERIQSKHQIGFGMHFAAIQEDFHHDFIRKVCSKPEFIGNLKKIVYAPEGEDGYGPVDEASMRTKYENKIDPEARRVKEILDNPKIQIREFEARLSIYSPIVEDVINIRFNISINGHVTLYLPKVEFSRPKTDIEREDALYEIVRNAYESVIRTDTPYLTQDKPRGQRTLFEFLKEVE